MSAVLHFLIGSAIGNAIGGLLCAAFAGWEGRRFTFALIIGTVLSAFIGLTLWTVAS